MIVKPAKLLARYVGGPLDGERALVKNEPGTRQDVTLRTVIHRYVLDEDGRRLRYVGVAGRVDSRR